MRQAAPRGNTVTRLTLAHGAPQALALVQAQERIREFASYGFVRELATARNQFFGIPGHILGVTAPSAWPSENCLALPRSLAASPSTAICLEHLLASTSFIPDRGREDPIHLGLVRKGKSHPPTKPGYALARTLEGRDGVEAIVAQMAESK